MGYRQPAGEKLKNNFSNEWLYGERSQKGEMAERARGIKKYILVVIRFSFIEVQLEMEGEKKKQVILAEFCLLLIFCLKYFKNIFFCIKYLNL